MIANVKKTALFGDTIINFQMQEKYKSCDLGDPQFD